MSGHGLRLEVRLTRPEIDLPLDAADRGETHRQRTAEDAAGDDATDLPGGAHAVIVGPVQTEPGVHAERHAGLLDDPAQGDAFADGARQRLLAPDRLAPAGGHGGDDAVPMRRRADVDDVGVRHRDDLAEILGRQRRAAAGLLDALQLLLDALGVDVADADDAVLAGHTRLGVHGGDAAAADDDVVQRLAGRDEATAEDMPGDDREAKRGDGGLTEK